MDKQTFYTELLDRLAALGVGQDFTKQQLVKFEKILKGKTDEEIEQFLSQFDDLDRLAVGIKEAENAEKLASESTDNEAAPELESAEEATIAAEVSDSEDTAAEATAEGENASAEDEDAVRIYGEDAPDESADVAEAPVALDDDSSSDPESLDGEEKDADSETDVQATNAEDVDVIGDAFEDGVIFSEDDVISFTPVDRKELFDEDLADDNSPAVTGRRRGEKKKKDDDSEIPAEWEEDLTDDRSWDRKGLLLFWLYFLLSLPIALAAIASTLVVFSVLFFAIAVLIIAFVAVLVAITAVGTLVSVFGLIFGVAQMLISAPIGVYECGLAIMIGSAAMFAGILVYNVAVRLLPFLARCLFRLFKLIFRSIRRFYVFLKRRCLGE